MTLLPAIFLRRYKRFLADVLMEGFEEPVQVHCPNSGSMLSLQHERCLAYVLPSKNPNRKTAFSLEMLHIPSPGFPEKEAKKAYVCVNTHRANHVAWVALQKKRIAPLADYEPLSREPRWEHTNLNLKGRLDILLENLSGRKAFVEVKSVTMARHKGLAEFPDAITSRGTKHLKMLRDIHQQGHLAVLLFVVQRDDCTSMRIAKDIDALYGEELLKAQKEGVLVLAYRCTLDPKMLDGVVIRDTIPLESS